MPSSLLIVGGAAVAIAGGVLCRAMFAPHIALTFDPKPRREFSTRWANTASPPPSLS
jgi:hypothetical protein